MMVWLLIALMTAAAVLAVLWPLGQRGVNLRAGNDVAVYRDQLEEIDRDQASGAIVAAEADAARLEVSRRLLTADAADAARAGEGRADAPHRRRLVAGLALIALPAGALALYLALGSPDLPGQPLAGRIAQVHGNQSVAEMFARVERHLEQHPEDGRGWEVVAPIYMRLGRYEDAVKARRNALRLLGATAERYSDLGEALVSLANGVVTGDAKQAFESALRADPTDISARFYSGLAAEQDGRNEEAARIWRALAADAPEGATWLASVERALARVDPSAAATARAAPAAPATPAPAQDAMIRGMVERLAARLREDGSDVEGWIRLVRSYTVLRDSARAQAATEDARKALAGDAEKLARLETGLKEIAAGASPTDTVGPAVAATPATPAAPGAEEAASQDAMIRGMVERLAARLRQDGSDVEGWIRLVRSYTVLGEADKARAAADEARRALKGDDDKLRRLDESARSLGVGG